MTVQKAVCQNVHSFSKTALTSAEEEKKRKYLSAAESRHASITPFAASVDGALGHEALMFLQGLAEILSVGWGKSYAHVVMWIQVH